MKLIIGLGNPGTRYAGTRHNLGFLVIDRLAARYNIALTKKVDDADVGEGLMEGEQVVLAKPRTYMNRSGEAVLALRREYPSGGLELIVINDDLDLPYGRIRIRPSGGSGGHRGLVSIMENLPGVEFQRVRIGIGRPPEGVPPAEYVLQPFTSDEFEALEEIIARAAQAVGDLVRYGVDRAMATYNGGL